VRLSLSILQQNEASFKKHEFMTTISTLTNKINDAENIRAKLEELKIEIDEKKIRG